jgi:hypothetical protein
MNLFSKSRQLFTPDGVPLFPSFPDFRDVYRDISLDMPPMPIKREQKGAARTPALSNRGLVEGEAK